MDKSIKIGQIELFYDIESLASEARSILHENPDDYDEYTRNELVLSKIDFMVIHDKFIRSIMDLDSTIENLYKTKIVITKKGTIHQGRRQILLNSGITHSHYYNDDFGTNNYKEICLGVRSINDTQARVSIWDINNQDR